ncbi:50S ribosomal protein L18 [Candidatus Dependentiae bacterium]|nr:50S ribosomal protein L18 [Candidatus Dependentiae bacterium]
MVSLLKRLKARQKRKTLRVRSAQQSRGEKLRITVFRSLNHIYAQIIDDSKGCTLASCSSKVLTDAKGSKKEVAKQVGLALGKIAVSKNLNNVFFDRGGALYHGRVQALAEGLREAGLSF